MEIFWRTIAYYNSATWLLQIVIILIGIALTGLLIGRPYNLFITTTSMLFLPISRLEIPECMTGILTGAKMPCANPHLAPYTTTSF